jgi:hypothetical protein
LMGPWPRLSCATAEAAEHAAARESTAIAVFITTSGINGY